MIDDRDLDAAVAAGVLDAPTRLKLVQFARDYRRGEAGADEEQFRLLTGFNDIFVSIAIGLVLFAVGALGGLIAPALGAVAVAATSWGLAEYFTRVRRMALPSIFLLLTFVAATMAALVALLTGSPSFEFGHGVAPGFGVVGAAALTAVAAWLHWRRFMVPITVAAGVGALVVMVLVSLGIATGSALPNTLLLATAVCGLAVFGLAMWADSRDRARVTRWSDVAFWLHLLAAPLIVHPVFALAGLMNATPAPGAAVVVVLVYVVLTVVAVAIDRRALLVSALGYVIYAVQALLAGGGALSASFGTTALVIGVFLVALSAGWRPIRARVLALLPDGMRGRLPAAA